MQVISQSDYQDWKSNPVTKAYMLAVAESIGQVKEDLAVRAGLNSTEDNFYRGYVAAMNDVLQFRIDDLQEVVNND